MTVGGYAISVLVAGPLDETALRLKVDAARRQLPGERAELALVFVSPPLLPSIHDILEIVQVHGHVGHLVGCSAHGVIGQSEEVENGAAISILLLHLPGAKFTPLRIEAEEIDEVSEPDAWHERTGIRPQQTRGWLVFCDPKTFDAEQWLQQWNQVYPGVPTLGGLAGPATDTEPAHLFIDQEVYTDGAVGISVGGTVSLESVVSQGCTPIGSPWTITSAERNFIRRIGNLPALTVLQDTFNALSAKEKARANGNIFVGLVVDEYREEHRRGDFLVRNLLGADPAQGVVAVGARVRVGQTLQFQFRDATAASEDWTALLEAARQRLAQRQIVASILCSCAGRGHRLFGEYHHDTRAVHDLLGPGLPHAGFFANGELGPVGVPSPRTPRRHSNFLHGYTASLALFVVDDAPTPSSSPHVGT